MIILHLCLGNFYIDNFNYQENILSKIDKKKGHDVTIIASTETYIDNSTIGYVAPGEYKNEDGIRVVRLPYMKIGSNFVTRKVRKYCGLFDKIEEFRPDVIFSHSLCFSVGDLLKYKRKYPAVKIYADTHTAEYNSGKNWISLNLLHKVYYKHNIQRIIPYIEKYFYIGVSERDFSIDNYDFPESKMEYFPLGGIIPSKEEYKKNRNEKRTELGIGADQYLLVHSGKLTAQKRTEELITAFNRSRINAVLIIIGSISNEMKPVLEPLIDGQSVKYLGWKKGDELSKYLCACDLYCQPGSVSATLQQAICHFSPVLAYPHDEYQHINSYYDNFLFAKSTDDLENVFNQIQNGEIDLETIKEKTERCANTLLDYEVLEKKYTV